MGVGNSDSQTDEALGLVGQEEYVADPAVTARAVRKIDVFFIPAMMIGCKSILP